MQGGGQEGRATEQVPAAARVEIADTDPGREVEQAFGADSAQERPRLAVAPHEEVLAVVGDGS